MGIGGEAMERAGARIIVRTDRLSAMGYSGLITQLPAVFSSILRLAHATKKDLPACVIAVDVWQPLRVLRKWAPHLAGVPHVCYLPPGPNLIGSSRVHPAASAVFGSIVASFPHQARLFREAGAHVVPAAHAGLEACREETRPLPALERENVLALLPGSRSLEVRYGLPVQYEAARRIRERYPALEPVICCAGDTIERYVKRHYPDVRRSRNAREVMARARFGLICSGTASLEAAVLGCPGVVTYNGSPLQRWEWYRFHVPALARLRAAGIASPYIALPNILAGEELYPEIIDAPPEAVAAAAIAAMDADPTGAASRAALDRLTDTLSWDDAGAAVAGEVARLIPMAATGSVSG